LTSDGPAAAFAAVVTQCAGATAFSAIPVAAFAGHSVAAISSSRTRVRSRSSAGDREHTREGDCDATCHDVP
jgi:hypothetical protein